MLSFLKLKFIIILLNTLKIACNVLRWRSVKTKRGFFGTAECSETMGWLSSFLLHVVAKKNKQSPVMSQNQKVFNNIKRQILII